MGGFGGLNLSYRQTARKRCCFAVMSQDKTSSTSVPSQHEASSSPLLKIDSKTWLQSLLALRTDEDSRLNGPFGDVKELGLEELLGGTAPGSKTEEWRFTSIASLYAKEFALPKKVETDFSAYYSADAGTRLVIVDGVFDPRLSDLSSMPDGLTIESARNLSSDQAEIVRKSLLRKDVGVEDGGFFARLNVTCFEDAILIEVAAGVEIEKPIQIIVASSQSETPGRFVVSHPRIVLRSGKMSKVDLVEHHVGDSKSFVNCCTSLSIGDGSKVSYGIINELGDASYQLSTVYGNIGRDATGSVLSIGAGGKLARATVALDMLEPGAHAEVHGFSLGNKDRVVDLTSRISHDAKHCTSNQLQKNIAAEKGRTVFRGKIVVTENGDGTDSEQLCRSLLLSKRAIVRTYSGCSHYLWVSLDVGPFNESEILTRPLLPSASPSIQADAMPVLEISTDDVKCTHGATVADIEDEQLFYITSRGLSSDEARFLLIRSFAIDVIKV